MIEVGHGKRVEVAGGSGKVVKYSGNSRRFAEVHFRLYLEIVHRVRSVAGYQSEHVRRMENLKARNCPLAPK